MNLTLTRTSYNSWGVVSSLTDETGDEIAVTLEHAYPQDGGSYAPKLNAGDHPCVFGKHQLDHGPVETYEITDVPGHSGILFHIGNYNHDSDGCVLLGTAVGDEMISGSRQAFVTFLAKQNQQPFTLTVIA